MGRRSGCAGLAVLMITTLFWPSACSRTQMYFSLSIVKKLKEIDAG
jgi:hypothetical protein